MPQKNISKSLVLVDTSYTSFYRFFATIRWFSFAFPEEFKKLKEIKNYNWLENKIFIEKYEKMYLDSIKNLIKKKVFENSIIIFCMDSPKQDLWRTELKSDYKGDRIDLSLKHNFKPTFNYTYDTMIPEFIKSNSNIHSLRIDKLEADDLIAIISIYLENNYSKQQVYIVSGDDDFLQLGRPNLIFANYKKKKPFTLSKEEAKDKLKNKILLGDKSDCIEGIFKNIMPRGKFKQSDIINSDKLLDEYLEMVPEAKKRYELNKKMIDFQNIPKTYFNKVAKMFDKKFSKLLINQNNEIEV
jgi:5'-3' exonuclease